MDLGTGQYNRSRNTKFLTDAEKQERGLHHYILTEADGQYHGAALINSYLTVDEVRDLKEIEDRKVYEVTESQIKEIYYDKKSVTITNGTLQVVSEEQI